MKVVSKVEVQISIVKSVILCLYRNVCIPSVCGVNRQVSIIILTGYVFYFTKKPITATLVMYIVISEYINIVHSVRGMLPPKVGKGRERDTSHI